jgi:hypothetical protein
MDRSEEEAFYSELEDYPRPQYPFPDLTSPHAEELASECDGWIDENCPFASSTARSLFKKHRFTDIAAQAFPGFTLEEPRPIARFSAFFAMIDDYLDHASQAQVGEVRDRVTALLIEQNQKKPEPGFYHQVYVMRMWHFDACLQGICQRYH